MNREVMIILPSDAVIQILDGLEQRLEAWKRTEKYLKTGHIEEDCLIEECSDPEEANSIACFYTEIIELIRKQFSAYQRKKDKFSN
jgi:hypothetical protein